MIDCYLGEIRLFAGDYAPEGWALCNGQLLPIAGNDALYALIGTTYGGDGITRFALPDLQGRIPIQSSPAYPLGMKGGTEQVTLLAGQLPAHSHLPAATKTVGSSASPSGATWATTPTLDYSDNAGQQAVPMSGQNIVSTGGGLPHENMMPSLTLTFIIALSGIYPSQN